MTIILYDGRRIHATKIEIGIKKALLICEDETSFFTIPIDEVIKIINK